MTTSLMAYPLHLMCVALTLTKGSETAVRVAVQIALSVFISSNVKGMTTEGPMVKGC